MGGVSARTVIEVKALQVWKAYVPMAVTEAGISMEEKVQPLKAAVSMVVISSGMTVFLQPETKAWFAVWIMALQLLGELYTGLFSSTVMETRLVQ